MTVSFRFKDIGTVVPATQPSWLYFALAYEIKEEDGSMTKEWADQVCPVLAYAALTKGYGAYLVNDSEGPTWIYMTPERAARNDVKMQARFFVGDRPERGTAPAQLFDEYSYAADELGLIDLFESDCISHIFD